MSSHPDDEQYAAFYADTFGRVVRQLRPIVGTDAEDLAQEALLVACRRWDVVQTLDRPDAWVRRVAMRMGARRAGREHARKRLEAVAEPPCDAQVPDLDLVAAILDLPDRHAAAIRLHHLEDRPIAELAEVLGVSEGAARVLLLRARRLLAEHLTGLTGRWVLQHTWTIDALARHLRSTGWGHIVEPTIDGDWYGRGGSFELTIRNGTYALRRDDGRMFDHGSSQVIGSAMEVAPSLNGGR